MEVQSNPLKLSTVSQYNNDDQDANIIILQNQNPVHLFSESRDLKLSAQQSLTEQ